jgi:hypothetical protein
MLASDLVYALVCGLGTFTFGDPRTATLKASTAVSTCAQTSAKAPALGRHPNVARRPRSIRRGFI